MIEKKDLKEIESLLSKVYDRLGFVVLWLFFIMYACCNVAVSK